VELVGRQALPAHELDARAGVTTRATRIVYGVAAGFAVLFVSAATLRYFAYAAGRFDLGDMVQAIWSTAHGHFLQVTDSNGRETVRLGGHVDMFLVLLVPLWWVWPSPLMLLVFQALAVAAGALPVYWLARKHLGSERTAANFAFAYLLYPATQFNAFTPATGFHPVSIAVPFVLFAIWFLDEDRLVPFVAFALLAASTKEEIPAAVGCLGIWYAVRKGRRVAGLSIFTVGLAVTLVNFLVVIPHYAPNGTSAFGGRYADVGSTPGGILRRAVTDPGAIVHSVATVHKLAFCALVLAPFLGLWLLEPLLLLGAVPDLAINLLSSKSAQTSIGYHYTAGIVPFVIAASVLGASRVRGRAPRISLAVLVAVCLVAVLSPLALVPRDLERVFGSGVRAARTHALDLIPAGASVSASNQLGAYLSARRLISVFPYGRRGSWMIVDLADPSYPTPAYRHAAAAIASDPDWMLVYSSHGIEVLRRMQSAGA
jgi:uncharacterized membrane protein